LQKYNFEYLGINLFVDSVRECLIKSKDLVYFSENFFEKLSVVIITTPATLESLEDPTTSQMSDIHDFHESPLSAIGRYPVALSSLLSHVLQAQNRLQILLPLK
tara:strand:- start:140 stop:451 length:312 start_codon:yes stop_codon:yes gene_type:complete